MTTFKTVATVRADVLKGLLLIAAKDDVRYYLNGIYVDTANGVLVGTDGHKMLMVKCDLDKSIPPFILSRTTCNLAIKSANRLQNDVRIDIEEWTGQRTRTIRLHTFADMSVSMNREVDGQYPDWMRVIPQECSNVAGQFNVEYLETMQRAFRLALNNNKKTITVLHDGPTSGALILADTTRVMGIVMPMRMGSHSDLLEERALAFREYGIKAEAPAGEKQKAA